MQGAGSCGRPDLKHRTSDSFRAARSPTRSAGSSQPSFRSPQPGAPLGIV